MYVDSSAFVRVNGSESEQFRIDSGVETGVHHVSLALRCMYGWSDEGGE